MNPSNLGGNYEKTERPLAQLSEALIAANFVRYSVSASIQEEDLLGYNAVADSDDNNTFNFGESLA